MKRKSILVKTFFNLFSVMMLLVLVMHFSIFTIYKNFYVRNCTKQIDVDMKYVREMLENTENYEQILSAYARNNNVNITLKIKDQTKFYRGNSFFLDFFSEQDDLVDIRGVDGMDAVLFRTKEVCLKRGEYADVQISMNMQHLKESRETAISLLPYSLLISLLFSLFFSYFYSKKITTPILSMSRMVKDMTRLEQKAEITIKNQDELGVLADDINDLYQNLLQVIGDYKEKNEEVLHMERERLDFFRSASHELKTPLAKLSVLTENMKYNVGKYKDHEKYLEESLVIIQEMSSMIHEILNGVKRIPTEESREETCVRDCLKKVSDSYRLIAKSRHLELQVKLEGNMKLCIPRAELEKVFSNLLSNAVKYSVDQGKILVASNEREVKIYNEAPTIPKETMDKIWKGEYILGKSEDTKSSGLGLYIVKTILDRYKIQYSFEAYQKGYLFTIRQ